MKKVIICHPGLNQNLKNAIKSMEASKSLSYFVTTISTYETGLVSKILPKFLMDLIEKRKLPRSTVYNIIQHPKHTIIRLLTKKSIVLRQIAKIFNLPISNDKLYEYIDKKTERVILLNAKSISTVYCYEDGAEYSFKAARSIGKECIYELPIGYWRQYEKLMHEEILREGTSCAIDIIKISQRKKYKKDIELKLADKIIVPSSYVQDSLELHPGFNARVYRLPYGCPKPILEKDRKWSSNGRLKLLFVGGLSRRKGIKYLEEIYRQVSTFCDLTIIGNGIRNKYNSYLLNNSKWYKDLTNKEVMEAMLSHDILILPSLHEGMSLATLEALSRGMAVLVTENCGTSDLLSHGKDGFVCKIRDTKSMVESLKDLRDYRYLKSMGRAAIETGRKNNWSVYQKRLEEIIDD